IDEELRELTGERYLALYREAGEIAAEAGLTEGGRGESEPGWGAGEEHRGQRGGVDSMAGRVGGDGRAAAVWFAAELSRQNGRGGGATPQVLQLFTSGREGVDEQMAEALAALASAPLLYSAHVLAWNDLAHSTYMISLGETPARDAIREKAVR